MNSSRNLVDSRSADGGCWAAATTASPGTTTTAATATQTSVGGDSGAHVASADGVLLELTLPVTVRAGEGCEATRPLGITVSAGKGGASGVSRMVAVRLTDPRDPFFLFELELLEDDYGAFKQRLELRVDFSGFPRYLVNMVSAIAGGTSACELKFIVPSAGGGGGDGARGTLRLLEATEFRVVEHVSLVLARQGDVRQKHYLAERFRLFESAYHRTCAEAAEAAESADHTIAQLRERVSSLEAAERAAREEAVRAAASAERDGSARLAALREEHAAYVTALRAQHDARVQETEERLAALQRQLLEETKDKSTQIAGLKERVSSLDSALSAARSNLRSAEDTVSAQTQELQKLRATNAELNQFKLDVTCTMSNNEVNYATVSERLRAATRAVADKDAELASLREQNAKQDSYIHVLSTQNDRLTAQQEATGKSLEKAHHIIATQLQALRAAKDKYRSAAQQLRTDGELLAEREAAVQRARDDLAAANQRVQSLLQRNGELKEQLESTEDARGRLEGELKQMQAALLSLQRSTVGQHRHRWGSPLQPFAPAPAVTESRGHGGVYGASPSPAASYLQQYSGAGVGAAAGGSGFLGGSVGSALADTGASPAASPSNSRQASAGVTAASTATTTTELAKTEPRRLERHETPEKKPSAIKAVNPNTAPALSALADKVSSLASKSFFGADGGFGSLTSKTGAATGVIAATSSALDSAYF